MPRGKLIMAFHNYPDNSHVLSLHDVEDKKLGVSQHFGTFFGASLGDLRHHHKNKQMSSVNSWLMNEFVSLQQQQQVGHSTQGGAVGSSSNLTGSRMLTTISEQSQLLSPNKLLALQKGQDNSSDNNCRQLSTAVSTEPPVGHKEHNSAVGLCTNNICLQIFAFLNNLLFAIFSTTQSFCWLNFRAHIYLSLFLIKA